MLSETEKKQKKIYMDYAAATPLSESVLDVMTNSLVTDFANPSGFFSDAVSIRTKLEQARKSIADHLSTRTQEIIFTDGGSEANNLAIRGFVDSFWNKYKRAPLLVTSLIEHASVLELFHFLEERGKIQALYVGVNEQGQLNLTELKKILREQKPDLISIGYVNGEIGVIQDIKQIAKMIRHHKKHQNRHFPLFHTDAVQAVNYCDINVQRLGVDMMTINASKIYGPKKIAALYKKTPVQLAPLIVGGEQESSHRAGTENVAGIVAFAQALSETRTLLEQETLRLAELQKYGIEKIHEMDINIMVNGQGAECIPNIINISIPDISSEEILLRLDAIGIQASVKSACKSDEVGDSHVIRALRDRQTQSLRFSLGRNSKKSDIDYLVENLSQIITKMKDIFEQYYKH